MNQAAPHLENPPVVGNSSLEPALPQAAVQAALCAGFLGARGAGIWVGGTTLELVWSRSLCPEGCPPDRFQEFLRKCFARAFARKAPFAAKDTEGNPDVSFLFVPIGSPLTGVAVFSGDSQIWPRFQASRSVVSSALAWISPAVVSKANALAVPLLRSSGARGAAGVCADHLCEILGAKRVSVIRQHGKKKRLLACSGVAKIDSHSPEVAVILEKFSTLPPPDLSNSDFGGFLSRWCPLPEAAAIGVLIENPSRAADVDKVLSADAALVVHAIDSKRHALEAFLFPAADASRAGWRRHIPFTWIGVVLFFLLVLLFPVSETISGPCELVPARRASAVAQTTGRIERVLVSEGSVVTKGAPLFQIGDSKLRAQLEIMLQQQARFDAEVRLRRGEGDMQALRSAALEKDRLSSEIETIHRDIADSTIAAPLDGAVISKDLDLRLGEVVQPGTILCEVASLEDWDLLIRVDEADAGPLERAIAARKDLPVRFALQARADLTLQAYVTSPSEISQMVYTEAGKSFMYVTVKGINLPDELKGEIRPGFSGFAKIEGRKLPLAYNLASRAIHFLKLRFLL
jgi:biotin carboxyl carrier protein